MKTYWGTGGKATCILKGHKETKGSRDEIHKTHS
jgi:hypothetical protein